MVREELNEQIRYLVPANMFKTNINRSVMVVDSLTKCIFLNPERWSNHIREAKDILKR